MFRKPALVVSCFLSLGFLAGCVVSGSRTAAPSTQAGLSGSVHGGQQPVVGATIQLYTVGTTGDGSGATPLLTTPVLTTTNGAFNITNDYSCANATQVYLVATGGNPGLAQNNPNLALMTALGPCSALTPSTNISVNELTTVAAVYALAPYTTGYAAIGSSGADVSALNNAFALAGEYVNPSTGLSPGLNVPNGDTVPTPLLNTLSDVVAACVNSAGGTAGDSSACGQVFGLTTPPGSAPPVNTIGSLLYLALNPTLNTGALFSLASPSAPFQPTLSMAPPDFRVRLSPPANQLTLQITPGSLTLAPTAAGLTSAAQAVTVMNSSAAAVAINAISLTGANSGDFAQTNNCGASLAGSASCTVQVSFTPGATGARSGYLSIVSNTPDSPQYVALSGSGFTGMPQASFSAQNLTFLGTGLTKDVTLSNVGTAPLTIAALSTVTPHFSATNTCGGIVAPGGSCTVSILNIGPGLDPNFGSNYQDVLTLVSNDPAPHPGVYLIPATKASFNPSNVLIPNAIVGSTTTTTISGLLNNYTNTCADFTVSGAGFSGSGGGGSGAGGGAQLILTCTYTLTFQPTAPGNYTGRLSWVDGYIPLSATAIGAASTSVTLTPSVLNLTNSTPGSITLSNYSSSAVNIQSIATSAGFTQTNNCGNAVAAQSVCTINVAATSSQGGGMEGALYVTDDLGSQSAQVVSTQAYTLDFLGAPVGTVGQILFYFSPGSGGPGSVSENTTGDFLGTDCSFRYLEFPCYAPVTFKPAQPGLRTGTLIARLQNGGGTIYSNYLLKGVGTSGPSLMFGQPFILAVKAGATSGFSLNTFNTGTTPLNLSFALTGPNASEFSLSPNYGPSTLAVGTSSGVSLNFSPTTVGVKSATLVATDSNSGQTFSLPINGVGAYGNPMASPGSLNFQPTHLNATSSAMSLMVSVPAAHALQATSSSSQFVLTKSSCAQGESPCLINVVYAPTNSGAVSASLTLTDAVTGNSASVPVTGTGGIAQSSVSPGSINFPARAVGTTSVGSTVTLSNGGDGLLNLTGIVLAGANSAEFSLMSSCGSTLAAQASCTFNVSFAPSAAGSKAASVTISGDAGGLPLTVSITGMAQ